MKKVFSLILFLILVCLLILLFAISPSAAAAAERQATDPLAAAYLHARFYASQWSDPPHPIIVRSEGPDLLPHTGLPTETLGHTTRESDTCVLHIQARLLLAGDRSTIAHEVCHCMKDWNWLGPRGWIAEASKENREAAEHDAERCEVEMVKREDEEARSEQYIRRETARTKAEFEGACIERAMLDHLDFSKYMVLREVMRVKLLELVEGTGRAQDIRKIVLETPIQITEVAEISDAEREMLAAMLFGEKRSGETIH